MTSNFVIEFSRKAGEIYDNNIEKGFHDQDKTAAEMVALATTELSEAYEEIRKGRALNEVYFIAKMDQCWQNVDGKNFCINSGEEVSYADGMAILAKYPEAASDLKPEGWGVELADCVIRLMDDGLESNIDLANLIELKMRYNATREFMHGKTI